MTIKNTVISNLITLIALILLLLWIFKKDNQVFEVPKVAEVEANIETKETTIKNNHKELSKDKKVIKRLSTQIKQLRSDLEYLKQTKDTVRIIEVQDTIIEKLVMKVKRLDTTAMIRDSIIVDQRIIIDSKDTIIDIESHNNKRLKRQRNISILAVAIVTALTFLKGI